LKQPGSTRKGITPIALVAALALALPGVAVAQDPSVDQYTPTAPDGGGSVPTSPVPNTEGGNGGPGTADTGSSDGSSEPTAPVDSGTTVPTDPAATAPTETSTGSGGGDHEKAKSNDERTLDGLAATASVQRQQASSSGHDGPATELLRSDSGGGLGMGVFLWAVIGVTALWAIATVVRRRQDQDGHPA